MNNLSISRLPRPATWAVVLALGLVYVSWGTTYLAIGTAVRELPPALFVGMRLLVGGLLLLGYLSWRGQQRLLPMRELLWLVVINLFLTIGGNWLLTVAQKTVPSGMTALLIASSPLWITLIEHALPGGERLTWKGWLGMAVGLAGVVVLLEGPANFDTFLNNTGLLLILVSAILWSVGSVILGRRIKNGSPRVATAAWQMIVGGTMMTVLGLSLGEADQITPERFTLPAIGAFVHLVVFGSLVGYMAYLWLQQRVSMTLASTISYVTPVVAVVVGALVAQEELTLAMGLGMGIVLASVVLVQTGRPRPTSVKPVEPAMEETVIQRQARRYLRRNAVLASTEAA